MHNSSREGQWGISMSRQREERKQPQAEAALEGVNNHVCAPNNTGASPKLVHPQVYAGAHLVPQSSSPSPWWVVGALSWC